ncbi:type 1 glutamine amidotransferase [Acidiferrobacter sp.]|jgi:GMP synthase-like glutamine amidotransferase|uniref:type 1 glutamine amidotransferase n=1 Tax=Acidiferrobacter sp. TaxID=1872107 RepID=UPI00262D452E|nr:type 1 glutamine amidotransferase [Acidiferrobacter sp.]
MKPLAIFRHAPGEGPGYLADVLKRHGLSYTLIRVDEGDAMPPTASAYSALVFMGGPMSVNDPLPWIPQALRLIREAQGLGQPVLGHCLGGQLISKALGGVVGPNPVIEIGWGLVERVPGEASARWLAGLSERFEVFHWHGETFTIPEGGAPILTSPFCRHQGFVIGRTLALQCHIEMTTTMIDAWAGSPEGRKLVASPSVQTADVMREDAVAKVASLHAIADAVYARWLDDLCV